MNQKLIDKAHKVALEMMSEVSFDKEAHVYTCKSDGSWLQGVSTVSSIIPKPWLAPWGSKEAVKFLGFSDYPGDYKRANEVLDSIVHTIYTTANPAKEFIELLREAKGASKKKSKDALVDGTAGHKWIETYVKARIRKEKLPEIPEGMLKRPLTQFVEWEQKNVDYWILSEVMMSSVKEGYAGTVDGLAMMKTGKLAVIDYKFSSRISEDAYLQTAGYQNCFEKHGLSIDERIIIRLPKTLEKEVWDKKTRTYSKVENKIEIKFVETDYEFDRDVFLHCLPLKKWINKVQNN